MFRHATITTTFWQRRNIHPSPPTNKNQRREPKQAKKPVGKEENSTRIVKIILIVNLIVNEIANKTPWKKRNGSQTGVQPDGALVPKQAESPFCPKMFPHPHTDFTIGDALAPLALSACGPKKSRTPTEDSAKGGGGCGGLQGRGRGAPVHEGVE